MKGLYKKINSRRRSAARRYLAGLLLPAFFMLSGCGEAGMDPLGPPTEISYNRVEKETVTVERGNLTPEFQKEIEVAGFNEVYYSVDLSKMLEMEILYKAKIDSVLVSEGDRVNVGDTLITFSSETLDEKKEDLQSSKNISVIRRDHYLNLQAIDSNYDYYDDIIDLNGDISMAEDHIADVDGIYAKMNIISQSEGVVSYINESVRNGSMVTGTTIIKVVSDDGYYVMDNTKSEKAEIAENFVDLDFKIGERYTAKFSSKSYELEVIADPTGGDTATIGDASTGDKVYFKLVGDEPLHERKLTIIEELPEIKDVCYVDRRAIILYEGDAYVYKVLEDGTYRATKVVIGDEAGIYTVIKEGVNEGDTLAIID